MTCLYVVNWSAGDPYAIGFPVEVCRGALSVPPATLTTHRTVALTPPVVVAVRSGKQSSVSDVRRILCYPHRVTGVSAVPIHRQLVQTSLITDGERRVFSPVRQTVSTLDLQTTSRRYSILLNNDGRCLERRLDRVCNYMNILSQ